MQKLDRLDWNKRETSEQGSNAREFYRKKTGGKDEEFKEGFIDNKEVINGFINETIIKNFDYYL